MIGITISQASEILTWSIEESGIYYDSDLGFYRLQSELTSAGRAIGGHKIRFEIELWQP